MPSPGRVVVSFDVNPGQPETRSRKSRVSAVVSEMSFMKSVVATFQDWSDTFVSVEFDSTTSST